MAIPVINLGEMNGEKRNETMRMLHEACANWGFFWVENHGIDKELMEKVKGLVNLHYEDNLKEHFYNSELAKKLGSQPDTKTSDVDWETAFFVRHQPASNTTSTPNLEKKLSEAMQEYVDQLVTLAEKLAGFMSENLALEKNYLKEAFSQPCVGTKVAIYPQCPKPELVTGLRGHSDAGGIILLLQDDKVLGLQFLKDGDWVPIPPSANNRIFVNLGDQLEVVSNGIYKSIWHRVLPTREGSRLSIATFYNPGENAIISPAPKLLYPSNYHFGDYLEFYNTTKFGDKGCRFETFKQMTM